jgi:hypothetical protein
VTDRPHDPAVELVEGFLRDRWQGVAVQLMPSAADRQFIPLNPDAQAIRGNLHYFDTLGDDFRTDVVTQEDPHF